MKTKIKKGTLERNKMLALLKYMKGNDLDIRELSDAEIHEDGMVEIGRNEYLVLTNEEAAKQVREYILDSVWSFNKTFLDQHSTAIAQLSEEIFEAIQTKCEDANSSILALINNVDYFVEDAIYTDGRGHFLSSYDGEENEAEINGTTYYIYRIN